MKTKDTLCIVASHPLAKRFDFNRDDCDIWGFNEILKMDWYKRADVIFQLHLEPIWRNPTNRNDQNYLYWLKNISGQCNVCKGEGCQHCNKGTYYPKKRDGVTIFMQEEYKDVPNSVKYPLDEIKTMLQNFKWVAASGYSDKTYLTSSPAEALALGIYMGYKKIECWGVEMNTDTEYRYQRDCITFWQGVAAGKGIEVIAYTEIYNSPIYGYEGEAELKYESIQKRNEDIKPVRDTLYQNYLNAAKEAESAIVHFSETGKDAQKVQDSFRKQIDLMFKLHTADGAMQENSRYLAKADAMKESAGTFQFSRQEFEQSARKNAQDRQQMEINAHSMAGACDALFSHAAKHKNYNRRRAAMTKFKEAAQKYLEASGYVGLFTGAYQENQNYLALLDKLIKAAGGEKSEEVLLNTGVLQDA